MTNERLTTAAGAPVVSNDDVQTAGRRGPVLLQDVFLIEKLSNFNREVIPERRMHAKGSGAFGKFTVTNDITNYSKAAIFSEVGKETEMFARFSTVAGERGAADAERDIRGFSLKFYTEEGNWDMVGNNTPVFFFRDPLHFPDLNHVVKRDPKTNMHNGNSNWDFWSSLPEALHQVTIVMSDRGIPANYRQMHGFGSHTYSMINAANERVYVKFHFRSQNGIENFTGEEAAKVIGQDRESSQRDLFENIEQGNFPKWKMYIQVMTEEQARNHYHDPFDLTKVWYKSEYPLIEVGEFELNRNPENYFADVEQAAFAPSNVVPGISFSPDRMLQARLFAYQDAARYRLGVNHHQIPVNTPKCPFMVYHRDGQGRADGNRGSAITYYPNSYGALQGQPQYKDPALALDGPADIYDYRQDDNAYFEQPGKLFNLMTPEEQQRLFETTANDMNGVEEFIKRRHILHCYLADPAYGEGVAKAMGLTLDGMDLSNPYTK